ncbi:hypothetical protein C2845_PM03G24800 [Panicum miliaceum]|uniref:Uncharacterized protein n=1 Tax=Panicum miliaceum TaxID=4540 RepID=A0A3L6T4X3_PANMI|nr:hypothetical protein C2845_PM03G24800 [Panicum miliaceum]
MGSARVAGRAATFTPGRKHGARLVVVGWRAGSGAEVRRGRVAAVPRWGWDVAATVGSSQPGRESRRGREGERD